VRLLAAGYASWFLSGVWRIYNQERTIRQRSKSNNSRTKAPWQPSSRFWFAADCRIPAAL